MTQTEAERESSAVRALWLEWLVTRPIHFFVSQPQMEPIFGHVPHENPYGNYAPYDFDDFDGME